MGLIDVPQEVLDNLAGRLRHTRRPPVQTAADGPPGGQPHEDPATFARIDELIGHWPDWDWRALERRINAIPQQRIVVDGASPIGTWTGSSPGSASPGCSTS